jgi:hypothetical protein
VVEPLLPMPAPNFDSPAPQGKKQVKKRK